MKTHTHTRTIMMTHTTTTHTRTQTNKQNIMFLSANVSEDSYLKCCPFGTLHCFQSWTCPSPRSCGSRWCGCYRPGQAMLLSITIAAFSLSQAHHAVPGPGSVPATGAVVHTLGVTATLLLSPFLRHTLLFLVLGLFRCRSCG